MKVVSVAEAKAKLSQYLNEAQKERVLVTNHGKPVALLIGVQGEEMEDLMTQMNPKFWKMIERTRQEPTRPLTQVAAELEARNKKAKGRRRG